MTHDNRYVKLVEILAGLLKERHDFPDYPGPEEGLVSTEDDHAEQDEWRKEYDALDDRIRRALSLTEKALRDAR